MFEDLIRGLMPPQGRNALTPEQIAEAQRRAAGLPPAPAGEFFQVPANSPDRQAGQLIPLTNGQPTPDLAPIMGEADGRLGLRGSKPVDLPRAPTDGMSPLNVQAAPAPAGPVPKDVFSPPQGLSPAAGGFTLTRPDGSVVPTSAPQPSQFGQTINFLRGQNAQQGLDLFGQPMQASGPANSPEAIARQAMQLGDSTYLANMANRGHAQAAQMSSDLMRSFLGASHQQQDIQGKMGLQALDNLGRVQVAKTAADAANAAELDKMELHVRDAVGKGLTDPATGQALLDSINARRAAGQPQAGPAGVATAPGSAPAPGVASPAAGASTLSPPIKAGGDIAALRSLFGTVDASGRFAPNPASATGQNFTQLIDRVDQSQVPQIAAAIRSGQFGDPMAVRNAAFNSLAQNYLMSQGPLPGASGAVPGRYTIPYGPDNKPLLDMIASPGTNMLNRVAKYGNFATSGVPYDNLRLPDGTEIPFDTSGIQGLSEASVAGGYNQGTKGPAAQRLTRLAQLAELLNQTQPPGR